MNGDGYDDVVIAAPDMSSTGGAIVVFGGATGAHGDLVVDSAVSAQGWANLIIFSGRTYDGTNPVQDMGAWLGAVPGDVNGDGLSDFAIASNLNTDAPTVVYGGTALFALGGGAQQGSQLSGTSVADQLLGTSGADTLSGGGGADAISSGAGNDTVLVGDTGWIRVDGGGGVDTLKLAASASGVHLDFTSHGLGGKVRGFEGMDLTGGGDNSVTLTLQDVLSQPTVANTEATSLNEAHLMVISGDSGDVVRISNAASQRPGNWSAGTPVSAADQAALIDLAYPLLSNHTYAYYTNGVATLLVDNTINLVLMG